jgi:hypothetical protein
VSLLALLTLALLVSTILAAPTWADDADTVMKKGIPMDLRSVGRRVAGGKPDGSGHPNIGAVDAGPAGRTILASGMASADLAAPDQPGPYKVGFTTFPSTLGENLPTTITVWYPHCAVGVLVVPLIRPERQRTH